MSIYTQCADAARELARRGDIFTDLSVVQAADPGDWTDDEYTEARRHAPNILGQMYRTSKLCRYGTVPVGSSASTRRDDYVRRGDGLIIYADVKLGPASISTPNGSFTRILYVNDPLKRNGRPSVSPRNDFEPWPSATAVSQKVDASNTEALVARIAELESALADANQRCDVLEDENGRLRVHNAHTVLVQVPVTPELIERIDDVRAASQ